MRAPRRPATDEEARALASSLRLRILRLTFDEALTNKELAQRLGRDPATVLHHVRTLVETGFLAALPVRRGPRGARERPYRATGKSWTVDISEPARLHATESAMVEAFLAEIADVPAGELDLTRLALRVSPAERAELQARLLALCQEYVERQPGTDAESWALFSAVYPRR